MLMSEVEGEAVLRVWMADCSAALVCAGIVSAGRELVIMAPPFVREASGSKRAPRTARSF